MKIQTIIRIINALILIIPLSILLIRSDLILKIFCIGSFYANIWLCGKLMMENHLREWYEKKR